MQSVSVPNGREKARRPKIGIDIGQYHFITADGWKEQWNTISASEWWKKMQWLKAGGHLQDKR